jgi:hypothetical protein
VFIKISSGVQKLIRRDSQTHRQHVNRKKILLPFQNKEIRLKNYYPENLGLASIPRDGFHPAIPKFKH